MANRINNIENTLLISALINNKINVAFESIKKNYDEFNESINNITNEMNNYINNVLDNKNSEIENEYNQAISKIQTILSNLNSFLEKICSEWIMHVNDMPKIINKEFGKATKEINQIISQFNSSFSKILKETGEKIIDNPMEKMKKRFEEEKNKFLSSTAEITSKLKNEIIFIISFGKKY